MKPGRPYAIFLGAANQVRLEGHAPSCPPRSPRALFPKSGGHDGACPSRTVGPGVPGFRLARRLGISFVIVVCAATVIWLALPRPPLLEGVSFSQMFLDRHGRPLRVSLSADGKFRLWTPLAEIPTELIEATLFQEDRHFRQHPGVNPAAVARAAYGLGRRGGASTVSMQLARLRFGLRTRTIGGKLRQMLGALELERHYPKDRLLEAYLNLAPYGGNVEGIGAASRLTFGKTPAELTRPEIVALVVIPQSPARRTPRAGRENPALTAAANRLRERLERADERGLDQEFRVVAAGSRPFLAPHFVNSLRADAVTGGTVRTTLDLDAQRVLERRVANLVAVQAPVGVRNAAALLVDTRSMEVLAQVGSADFSNPDILGQVDTTRRPRSPGSALKPFVYALALDQGLIHPRTLLADAPRRFGDYEPENFDRGFAGPLPAAEALTRSRNVPAVALASGLRRPTLYGFLREAGVRLPRPESSYGLTLPLGGEEVTMEDVARLYALLGNGGELRPLRRIVRTSAGERSPTVVRLLSPEAAFLTREMLGDQPLPGLAVAPDPRFPVAWKTGTSAGCRDAWTAGVFDHFALVVWVGETNGQPNPAFVGRTAAAPLFFGIVNALRASGFARPDPTVHEPSAAAVSNLRRVELCAVSGGLPTAACQHRISGWFIPGVSPITRCPLHRETFVGYRREGVEVGPEAWGGSGPTGTGTTAGGTLRVLSPRHGGVYPVPGGRGEITLRAASTAVDPGGGPIYWFADRTFLGASRPGEALPWRPTPGSYHLLARDGSGHADVCEVTVLGLP